jgi:hypothetical protein
MKSAQNNVQDNIDQKLIFINPNQKLHPSSISHGIVSIISSNLPLFFVKKKKVDL